MRPGLPALGCGLWFDLPPRASRASAIVAWFPRDGSDPNSNWFPTFEQGLKRNEQGSRYRYELSNVDIPIRRVCPTVPGTAVVVVLCTRSYSNTLIWRLEIENDPFARPGMNVQ